MNNGHEMITPALIHANARALKNGSGCYDSLEYVGQEGSAWSTLAVLAYPAALIGLVGIVGVLVCRKR
jgi:hypothetical protein